MQDIYISMSIVLSYTLFDQDGDKFNRSSHDPLDKNPYRYWLNLPFIIILNNLIFPDSITKLYTPKKLENNRYYGLLKKLSEEIDSFKLVTINKDYLKTEPSIWRIKALWEDYDFCFCRDLDSVITKKEAQSMIFFMNSDFMIHNIRSMKCHNGEGTSLMAGLCGFNVNKIKKELPLPESFESYMKFYEATNKTGIWGCDQETLINFFIRHRTERVHKQMLDTYIQPKRNSKFGKVYKNKFYAMNSIDENVYNKIKFPSKLNTILDIFDPISSWAGQPVDASGKQLSKMLEINNDNLSNTIEKIINSDKEFKLLFKI